MCGGWKTGTTPVIIVSTLTHLFSTPHSGPLAVPTPCEEQTHQQSVDLNPDPPPNEHAQTPYLNRTCQPQEEMQPALVPRSTVRPPSPLDPHTAQPPTADTQGITTSGVVTDP